MWITKQLMDHIDFQREGLARCRIPFLPCDWLLTVAVLLDELSNWLLIGLERLSGCGLMLRLMNIHKRQRATCGLTLGRLVDESIIFQRLYRRFPWTLPDLFDSREDKYQQRSHYPVTTWLHA